MTKHLGICEKTEKRQYRDRTSAEAAARYLRHKHRTRGVRRTVEAYICAHCTYWHVGRMPYALEPKNEKAAAEVAVRKLSAINRRRLAP